MRCTRTNPSPYVWRDQDGPARPGVPLHHAWSTLCACCSARISAAQTAKRGGLGVCADREACKSRRAAGNRPGSLP